MKKAYEDNMKITEKLGKEAIEKGACPDAIVWLKEKPRTVQELYDYNIDWYIWALGNFVQCPIIGDVNAKSSSGNTALIWAIIKSNNNCLDRLIAAGADVNCQYGR